MGTRVYGLAVGDSVTFSGPIDYFAVKSGSREKIFIGAGAGMAHLRAMIRFLLRGGATESIHFWYGARSLSDAPYVNEFVALAARFPNFRWQLVLSEATAGSPAAAGLRAGRVHDIARQQLLRIAPRPGSCDHCLYGRPCWPRRARC